MRSSQITFMAVQRAESLAGGGGGHRSEGKSIKQLQVLKRHSPFGANEAEAIIISGIALLIGRQ